MGSGFYTARFLEVSRGWGAMRRSTHAPSVGQSAESSFQLHAAKPFDGAFLQALLTVLATDVLEALPADDGESQATGRDDQAAPWFVFEHGGMYGVEDGDDEAESREADGEEVPDVEPECLGVARGLPPGRLQVEVAVHDFGKWHDCLRVVEVQGCSCLSIYIIKQIIAYVKHTVACNYCCKQRKKLVG